MKNVYIWIDDKEYLIKLVNSINNKAQRRFIAIGVMEASDLDGADVSLLLVQEGIYQGDLKNVISVILTEKESLSDDEFKLYSKASDYVEMIFSRLNISLIESNEDKSSYAVISLVGVDKSYDFVKNIIGEEKKDKSLIWELLSFSNLITDDDYNGSESLLYSLKMKDDIAFDSVQDKLMMYEGINVIKSPACFMDIRELGREDFKYSLDCFMNIFGKVYVLLEVACLRDLDILNTFDGIVVISDDAHGNMVCGIDNIFKIAKVPKEKVSYNML